MAVLSIKNDRGQWVQVPYIETPGASSWDQLTNKPFVSVGSGLKVENDILKVDVINEVQADNTQPITSGAVYTEIGNIDALMSII